MHRPLPAAELDAVANQERSSCHGGSISDRRAELRLPEDAATASVERGRGRRNRRIDVYGPTGTKAYEQGYKRMTRLSIADQEGPLGLRPTFDRFARRPLLLISPGICSWSDQICWTRLPPPQASAAHYCPLARCPSPVARYGPQRIR
jgi:hypothetical protein